MASAIPEVVARIALAWMNNRPFSEEARERRKAKRAEKRQRRIERGLPVPEKVKVILPDGTEFEREEPSIPLRTSTKTGSTSSIGTIVLALVGVFFPDVVNNLTAEQALWIGGAITSVIAYVTARVTKSPIAKKAL